MFRPELRDLFQMWPPWVCRVLPRCFLKSRAWYSQGCLSVVFPTLLYEHEETRTAVLWVLSITRQFTLKQLMLSLHLPSSQAHTVPVLAGAFMWAQTQTETDWDGGARRGRQRLIALVHTSPECCWRHGVGVLHMAGPGRMAGLPVWP